MKCYIKTIYAVTNLLLNIAIIFFLETDCLKMRTHFEF